MITVFAPAQLLQDSAGEIIRGQLVSSFEKPERATLILAEIAARGLGPVVAPGPAPLDLCRKVHGPGMVDFLETAWDGWRADCGDVDALPNAWPPPRSRRLAPERASARLGAYCIDASSAVMAGTWQAATASAATADAARAHVAGGARSAFALCRPPGHHAGWDYFGGYCFLNNAAVAAQGLVDAGAARVAVLDVDYHHGNGTQDIFYDRDDVLTVSLHADPTWEYPYYLGYSDETGAGRGLGFNLNLPLPEGTRMDAYHEILDAALDRIAAYHAEALVVSLGVDTFAGDPISRFRLASEDFTAVGGRIAAAALPTVFVMEGGYATEALGRNVVNLLAGFES